MHTELILQAKVLASRTKNVQQIDMRRSVSSAYYAMFHALCENAADCLIGGSSPDRCERAWVQTYRAPAHNFAKKACERCTVKSNGYNFPTEIEDFAAYFVQMYEARMRADYNPTARFARPEVLSMIEGAKKAIATFQSTEKKHKCAFAALVLFQERKIGL